MGNSTSRSRYFLSELEQEQEDCSYIGRNGKRRVKVWRTNVWRVFESLDRNATWRRKVAILSRSAGCPSSRASGEPMSTLDAELNDFGAQLAMLGGHAADRDG
jgi:hypothetical protein